MKIAGYCVKCGAETGGRRRKYCDGCRPKSKYRNRIVTEGGKRFDSQGEHRHWKQLRMLEDAGLISGLETQVTYNFIVNGIHVCSAKWDFRYRQDGEVIVADFKSAQTRKLTKYQINRKLMKALTGIDVLEVTDKDLRVQKRTKRA